jgi:hypothetical protein
MVYLGVHNCRMDSGGSCKYVPGKYYIVMEGRTFKLLLI